MMYTRTLTILKSFTIRNCDTRNNQVNENRFKTNINNTQSTYIHTTISPDLV